MRGSVFSLRVKEPFSHLSAVTAFHCATKCRFPLQAVFVVQFLLLSIYWSSYTDSSCQESAFLLLASYDTHLDQLMIIANFQHFCNFCFKCKCVFPVFHKQVFFQLWFYSLFWFLPYSWWCQNQSSLLILEPAPAWLLTRSFHPMFLKYFPLCLSSLHHAPWPLSSSRWVPALKPKNIKNYTC